MREPAIVGKLSILSKVRTSTDLTSGIATIVTKLRRYLTLVCTLLNAVCLADCGAQRFKVETVLYRSSVTVL